MVSVKSIRRVGAVAVIPAALDHLILPPLTMAFMPAIFEGLFGAGAVPATIFSAYSSLSGLAFS